MYHIKALFGRREERICMAEKRKDNKGRNLFTGESQRKDGNYMYRCSDGYGKRHTIYAPTLKELRVKEKQLQKDIDDGLSINNGNMFVLELLKIYFESNKKWKQSTTQKMRYGINVISKYPIAKMKINKVKSSHIKEFYLSLYNAGIHKERIQFYHCVLKLCFNIALQDDWIRKNPCDIKLDFLPSNYKEKAILSQNQETEFLEFVKNTKKIQWYYDIFVIMLETGIRVGELLGLTLDDIDLKNRELSINHQLCSRNNVANTPLRIDTLKTEAGKREIYISDKAYVSFLNLIKRRDEETPIEIIIDGYSKFLLKSHKKSKIVTYCMLNKSISDAVNLYNQFHHDKIPAITPHSMRHTFCTRMIERGIDIKSLQYIMGHKNVKTTLDIYTHMSSDVAMKSMRDVLLNTCEYTN